MVIKGKRSVWPGVLVRSLGQKTIRLALATLCRSNENLLSSMSSDNTGQLQAYLNPRTHIEGPAEGALPTWLSGEEWLWCFLRGAQPSVAPLLTKTDLSGESYVLCW